MSRGDMNFGAVVLVGDFNWRKRSMRKSVAAWLFGRRDRFTHLGKACTVAWWRDEPYLIGFKEAST